MTLSVDDKGRLTCRKCFPPHSSFAAETDDTGRIILTRLKKEERPLKLVKPVRYKDGWLMPGEQDLDKLTEEIAQERQVRDENSSETCFTPALPTWLART